MESLTFALLILSIIAHFVTYRLIIASADKLIAAGLFGIDLNKITPAAFLSLRKRLQVESTRSMMRDPSARSKMIPESTGIIVGCVYLSTVLIAAALCGVPMLSTHAALCSISIMLLMGFADDVIGLSWGVKIALSGIATVPLVTSAASGHFVVLPVFLRGGLVQSIGERLLPGPHVGASLGLGPLHALILALICVFCTNSINIYAGVNGLESGQTAIISFSVILYALRHMAEAADADRKAMTLLLQLPFLGVCTALFRLNRYPSKVFVGDSFTYFSGMVFAVTAITNHFSKSLMLFFVPQMANFVLSLPQLCGYVACPPHRIPTWDSQKDELGSSGNWTVLNAVLVVLGPMHEEVLVRLLLFLQVLMNTVGLLALEMVRFLY